MFTAISASSTGLQSHQSWVDITANNLANLNTTSFKRNQVDFSDLLYINIQDPGAFRAKGVVGPVKTQVGTGVQIADSAKVFTNGPLIATGRDLDVAFNGDGFFLVTSAQGTTQYTRDGSFQVDASGTLRTSGGLALQPTITIPADATAISIDTDGTVSVVTASAPGTVQVLGQLAVAQFNNPGGLLSLGNNLYAETPESGAAIIGVAGAGGNGTIQQGVLEGSNVDEVTELTNLILAQNGVSFNSRAITVENEMIQSTLDLIA